MSTAPPVLPAATAMPKWLKWLLGCSAGFFLLVALCCFGVCFGGKALFGDLFSKMQKAEADAGLARAASERVAALDLEFPPALPEDVSVAAITDADVSRYLSVRRALEPQAAAFQALEDAALPQSGGAFGIARGIVGLVGAAADSHGIRRALLEAAEPALRAESMGPTDLMRLAEAVEWRFLRREQARALGIPEDRRREYLQLKMEERMIAAWTDGHMPPGMKINDRSAEEARGDLDRLRERLREAEAVADGRTALTGSTLAALEARKAELEALPTAGLQAMAPLTAEPPIASFMDGGNNIRIERSGQWGSGGEHRGEATAPAGETTAPSGEPSGAEAPAPASGSSEPAGSSSP